MEVSIKVNEINGFCTGAGGSSNAANNIAKKELREGASVHLEQGLLHITNKRVDIAGAHASALGDTKT